MHIVRPQETNTVGSVPQIPSVAELPFLMGTVTREALVRDMGI